MEKSGYIYVLTNESFHRDNWIKIGYAEDVERRVKELSNTSVPLPYEVYCTYEIPRIQGTKDPDKLLHDLISKLNPDLRISPNREFFEMMPWDAYDMLYAIAQMHGRTDKISRNTANTFDAEMQGEPEYSVDALYPPNSSVRSVYEKLRNIILSADASVEEAPRLRYIAYKMGKQNIASLWPRSNCIEVVLPVKYGQIKFDTDIVYDILNRKWTSEQYAFKFYEDTDSDTVRDIVKKVVDLKKSAK